MAAKKSSTPNRAFKVADQIQRDLTELIARELKDPRVGMVTLQGVEVTPDYAHAKVFFSLLTGDPVETQAALNQAAGFLRNGLFKRLHIHTVPTLNFVFDRTSERAADMNALIAKAVSSRAKEEQSMHAPRTRVQRRPVHGVLLLNNPLGLSSNDALQKAKWLLRAEKAGHTGTLDPLATGVLPLCLGAATKFSQLQLDAPKTYEAVALLGTTTTTGDAEGDVVQRCGVDLAQLTPERLAAVQEQFTGPIRQVPPMHSALKKDGKALYEYARAGVTVEREARGVVIHALKLTLTQTDKAQVAIKIIVTCSKGTYIRTLGEDIGAALGCGAHLTFLRRIDTGGIGVERCVTLAQLEAMPEAERLASLEAPESLLAQHVRVTLDGENAARFLSGVRRRGTWPDASAVAVFGENPPALLGVGHIVGGELVPDRLLSPLEIQQILEGMPHPQASGTLEKL